MQHIRNHIKNTSNQKDGQENHAEGTYQKKISIPTELENVIELLKYRAREADVVINARIKEDIIAQGIIRSYSREYF